LLFLSERTELPTDDAARMTVKLLGYLPLALEQAGSYIFRTGGSYTEYLELLQEYGLELLEEEKGINYDYIVTTTWQINMDRLTEAAKDLLRLCSCMAPDNIPMRMFEKHMVEYLPNALKDANSKKLREIKL